MPDHTVQTLEIDVPIEHLFRVAVDVESYPDWAQGVRSTKVSETNPQGFPHRVQFQVDGWIRRIQYVLVYSYQPPELISWRAEPGPDIAEMEGSYRFEKLAPEKTKVIYALRVVPTFRVPGFLRQRAENQVVSTALRGLRQRVQQLEEVSTIPQPIETT